MDRTPAEMAEDLIAEADGWITDALRLAIDNKVEEPDRADHWNEVAQLLRERLGTL